MPHDPRHLDADELQTQTRSLRALARALVADEHVADDLVQDAWVTALDRPPRQGWTLASWLRGITRNHARQLAREHRRREERERIAAGPERSPVDDGIERIDLLRYLLDQVRGLDEPYRSTILLRFFDGMSPRKIAHKQGVPNATVRTRLRRGVELLRARMDRKMGGDRRAWALPLAPFAAVRDGGPIATVTEGVARLAQLGNGKILAMTAKTKLVSVALLLTGVLTTIGIVVQPPDGGLTDSNEKVAVSNGDDSGLVSARKVSGEEDAEHREVVTPLGSKAKPGAKLVVTGVVRNAEGQPLAGVAVKAGKIWVLTSRDGSYSLAMHTGESKSSAKIWSKKPDLSGGDLLVTASQRGYVCRRQTVRFVESQSTLQLDFTLTLGFVITGRVTDAVGAPIVGATVWTFRTDERPTKTDAGGRYRLDDVDPGSLKQWVCASARGFVSAGADVLEKEGQGFRDFVLQRGAIVRGVVVAAGSQPVANAKLFIDSGKLRSEAMSDAHGRFEFPGVPEGRRRLVVGHSDYAADLRKIDVPAPGQEVYVRVDLVPGEVLGGVIQDSRGTPIPGAYVTASQGKSNVGAAKADKSGVFEIRGLPGGELWLDYGAARFLHRSGERAEAGTRDLRLTLTRGASLAGRVVAASDGEPVTKFSIFFFDSRVPAKRGKFSKAAKSGISGTSFVSQDGVFEIDGVHDGFVTAIEVRAEGYASTLVSRVEARIGASPDDHRIVLETGVRLTGQIVLASDGSPVAGATIKIVRPHNPIDGDSYFGGGWRINRCDDAGRFEFANVAAGAIHLAVEHPKWGILLHPVIIPSGSAPVHQNIRLDRQGVIQGIVRNSDGAPAEGVGVRLSAVDVPGLRSKTFRTNTDAAGKFTFSYLPRGVYRLARTQRMAKAKGKSIETMGRYVRITGSKRHDVALTYEGTATLRGSLSAPGSVPATVTVRLLPELTDDTPWERRGTETHAVAKNGAFLLEGVMPGQYRLDGYYHDSASDTWMRGTKIIEVALAGVNEVELEFAPVKGKK